MTECGNCGSEDVGFVDLYGGGREYICHTCGWSLVLGEEEV